MKISRPILGLLFSAILLVSLTTAASAQCAIGLYMDAEGTVGSSWMPPSFTPFDVYLVMHVESTVAGVAFTMQHPETFYFSVLGYGPSGLGLNVTGAGGNNVGLGECAIGFNNYPVVVAHYSVIHTDFVGNYNVITLGPNTDESPDFPVYADCADNLVECTQVSDLYLAGVGVEGKSIGAVKSLYGN